jgi:hypothetical protein
VTVIGALLSQLLSLSLSPIAVKVALTLFAVTLVVGDPLVKAVRPAGIEPATKCLEGTCSIR